MSQQELVRKIIQILENIGIQYMVTGSVVSSLQGEPRSTHDTDIIISLHEPDIKKLVKVLPQTDFYLDESSILESISTIGMFNLIDVKEGSKIDFWVLTDEPFDRSRFSRRHTEEFMGIKMWVSSPEDTILAKLRWAKLSGGSEKQFIDALRVYEVQFEKLDMDYLEIWVKKLGVEPSWQRLKSEAEVK